MREGETHAAARTSTNNTPESFIVGIGAAGALLAGAAIVFVTLVGIVSFNVWPTGSEGSVNGNVELSAATPGGSSAGTAAPVSAAAGQLASTSVPAGQAGGGAVSPKGGNGAGKGGNGGQPKSGLTNPPATTTPPPTSGSGDSSDSGGGSQGPGTATKSPTHPVHPAHPDDSHGNVDSGTNSKGNPGTGNDSDGVITGKGPFGRPTPPSSSGSGFNLNSNSGFNLSSNAGFNRQRRLRLNLNSDSGFNLLATGLHGSYAGDVRRQSPSRSLAPGIATNGGRPRAARARASAAPFPAAPDRAAPSCGRHPAR